MSSVNINKCSLKVSRRIHFSSLYITVNHSLHKINECRFYVGKLVHFEHTQFIITSNMKMTEYHCLFFKSTIKIDSIVCYACVFFLCTAAFEERCNMVFLNFLFYLISINSAMVICKVIV